MFTGLVETIGVLRRRGGGGPVARALIETSLGPLTLGESISVQGACLTVDRIVAGGFECDMSAETLARTTLGQRPIGSRVHLERATPVGGRLGGHMVLGHVDGVGTVTAVVPVGTATRLEVRAPDELERFLAPKGSVCLDGVSLTLNAVGRASAGGVVFDVMLVPHTIGRTLLEDAGPGAHVNIEVDVLARYVARQLEVTARTGPRSEGRGEQDEPDVDHDERILAKLRSSGFA
jgi:riboflavin synthase